MFVGVLLTGFGGSMSEPRCGQLVAVSTNADLLRSEHHAGEQVPACPMVNESHDKTLMDALEIVRAIGEPGEIPPLRFACDPWCQGSPECSCPLLTEALTQTAQVRGVEPWATRQVLYWGVGEEKSWLWWMMRRLSTDFSKGPPNELHVQQRRMLDLMRLQRPRSIAAALNQ